MKKTPAQLYKNHLQYFKWSLKNPVSYNSIIKRIKMWWTNDMIIKTPRSEKNVWIKFKDGTSISPKNLNKKLSKKNETYTLSDLHKQHVEYIRNNLYDARYVSYASFVKRIKSWWTIQEAIQTPRNDIKVTKKKTTAPHTITNPVEWVDYHYVDNHSKKVDIVVTVMIIIWLLYYFKEQIQDFISFILS